MLSNDMHPRIATLAVELFALKDRPLAETTQWDRDRLMILKTTIRDIRQESGIQLDEVAENDRQYLFVEATKTTAAQEAFYESNGNKWAKRPYEEMCADEARSAIRACLRRKIRNGVTVEDIHAALRDEVGIKTTVTLSIHPEPINGRLPDFGKPIRFRFDFMAVAASGKVIS